MELISSLLKEEYLLNDDDSRRMSDYKPSSCLTMALCEPRKLRLCTRWSEVSSHEDRIMNDCQILYGWFIGHVILGTYLYKTKHPLLFFFFFHNHSIKQHILSSLSGTKQKKGQIFWSQQIKCALMSRLVCGNFSLVFSYSWPYIQ